MLAALRSSDVAIAHRFRKPPYGGSNQFLLALRGELRRRGLSVGERIGCRTRACLLNAYLFDEDRIRRVDRARCRVVHRVDGPITVYRGLDDGSDERIRRLNEELADVTVVQSRYSLEAHGALGIELRDPVVIPNAVDPAIFHPPRERAPLDGRRVRLISTSWSDNPNKGALVYRELERRLDWSRFEYTFVGRSPVAFERIRVVPPVDSREIAHLQRAHDVFVFASLHESCSNALLEALACGLPALYVDSGANTEVVGEAGLPFREGDDLPALLDRLVDEYEDRRARISTPSLAEVTNRYLEVMGLEPA